MSDLLALSALKLARDPDADRSGEDIWLPELQDVMDAFRAEDPAVGKPPGKFSPLAIKILEGQSVVVNGQTVLGIDPGECSDTAAELLEQLKAEALANKWVPQSDTIALPVKDDHHVFLTTGAGFAIDADG
ncbi:hypothetical protein ACFL6C_12975, partial [Myxococcota bacterium]